jgi:hypothetical protein
MSARVYIDMEPGRAREALRALAVHPTKAGKFLSSRSSKAKCGQKDSSRR